MKRILLLAIVGIFIAYTLPLRPEKILTDTGVEIPIADVQEIIEPLPTIELPKAETVAAVVQKPNPVAVASGNVDLISLTRQLGIPDSEYYAVEAILSHESGICTVRWQGHPCWSEYAEPYAGAEADPWRGYGLCQSTPAIKMATTGADWRTNPLTQLRWCDSYAKSRYGSWSNAWANWQKNRWW